MDVDSEGHVMAAVWQVKPRLLFVAQLEMAALMAVATADSVALSWPGHRVGYRKRLDKSTS